MTSNVITRHYPREDTDDADDADVKEGGGNVVEQERQHVSYQVLPGGEPRHRTGHTRPQLHTHLVTAAAHIPL